jgi:hypothetical protein
MKQIALSLFLIASLGFVSDRAVAAPMDSRWFHLYWGVGPNLSPFGNFRVGLDSIELGLIQGAGLGAVLVARSEASPFFQIGVVFENGASVLAGGGFEWRLNSYFRLRSDVSVRTDQDFQTQAFVSIGGVLVL